MKFWNTEKVVKEIISLFLWFITMWFKQRQEDKIFMKYLQSLNAEEAELFEQELHSQIVDVVFEKVAEMSQTLLRDEFESWAQLNCQIVVDDAADDVIRDNHPVLWDEYVRDQRGQSPPAGPAP